MNKVKSVAVGTVIARRPPHRSRRAELPHRAPTSGHDAEPHVGKGMPEACRWQPKVGQSFHALPCQPADLAPPPDLYSVGTLDGKLFAAQYSARVFPCQR